MSVWPDPPSGWICNFLCLDLEYRLSIRHSATPTADAHTRHSTHDRRETLNQRSKALNPEMHSPPRRTPTWLYVGQSPCMQPAFAVPPPARQAAAHEEPCVFFVRLVDSRLSTCSNVCELSMICRVASRRVGACRCGWSVRVGACRGVSAPAAPACPDGLAQG